MRPYHRRLDTAARTTSAGDEVAAKAGWLTAVHEVSPALTYLLLVLGVLFLFSSRQGTCVPSPSSAGRGRRRPTD
jgi:hypothetical protein